MPKSNLPKAILVSTFLAAFTLIAGLFVYGYLETKKAENSPIDFIEPIKSVENNNGDNNQEPEPTEPAEPETYEAEIFIKAQWGNGEGEVGISNYGGDEDGDGLIYGPQSFDIDDMTGYLYLLDSINERVLEYDDEGKYLKNFPIACGGTGDIRVSPDGKCLYIWSNRCGEIYKYDIEGNFLESYPVVPGKNPGIGTGGIEFDENGNVMLAINIQGYYDEETRFYQIGPDGDEWKTNSYKGNISRNKEEFYFAFGVNRYMNEIKILNRKGEVKKEFAVNLSQKAYVYYRGCDENNIYLDIGFEHGSMDEGFYFDDFIWKYGKDGKLIAKIDRDVFAKDVSGKARIDMLSNLETNGFYTQKFTKTRVTSKGDIYWMATFKNEGLKIFKYSKIE